MQQPSDQEDPFVGAWILAAERSAYEFGQPPLSGRYQIQAEGDGYLITMAWQSADGQEHEMSYRGMPDGQWHPYENPAVAEDVSMTRVDARTLDSASRKGDRVIAYARRLLSPDGQTMTVTQSGVTPEGQTFSNVSVYQRQP